MIDIKGERHRYIIQWYGKRVPTDIQMANRRYMDILTDGIFSPREITRVNVQHGHEDDTLLTFFDTGFIVHDGSRVPLGEKLAQIKAEGAMYRVQAMPA